MTFSDTIRVRLLLLIEAAGLTPTTLSKRMVTEGGKPRAHSYLLRKLRWDDDPANRRDLTTAEADEVLQALGLPPGHLLSPVFGAPDRAILQWLDATGGGTQPELQAMFADAERAIGRLERQGFIGGTAPGADVPRYFTITQLGRASA